MKHSSEKLVKSSIWLAAVLLFSTFSLTSCSDQKKDGTKDGAQAQTSGRGTEANSKSNGNALGVEVPTFQFPSDVQAYMRAVLAAPIPADYKLPDNVLNQPNYDAAVNQVGDNYPEFKNKEGSVLVAACQEYPYRYQEMIREARSVREHYFPGSQPKTTPE